MNRHFTDAWYYVKRAGEHAKKGVTKELEPVVDRFRELRGVAEPEPSRLDKIREELEDIEERAEGEAKEAVANARRRIRG